MNWFGKLLMTAGIALQILLFILYEDQSWLSLISGIAGIIAVVWCAERKYKFYTFAWIQLITYVMLCWEQKLWGEIGENVFYAVTMIGGMLLWNLNKTDDIVNPNKLDIRQNTILAAVNALLIALVYILLHKTNDTQPFMDSISTVPAITAQILLIFRYREQWIYWIIIDIMSIIMWAIAKDWIMVAQFAIWTINCVYGWTNWNIIKKE